MLYTLFNINDKILNSEDNILRVKAIMIITNNCSDILIFLLISY